MSQSDVGRADTCLLCERLLLVIVCACVWWLALTGSLELLFGGDRHFHLLLSLHRVLYVLHARNGLHGLVYGHRDGRGDGGEHADYDIERAATVLAVTTSAVLASAALNDRGCTHKEQSSGVEEVSERRQ